MILFWLLLVFFSSSEQLLFESNYTLEKVLIFSRHNVRSHLLFSKNITEFTVKPLPLYDVGVGYGDLTRNGAVLEEFMGEYFGQWFNKHIIIGNTTCPTDDEVFVYPDYRSDSPIAYPGFHMQRTVRTAKYFVDKAIPKCDVELHHDIRNPSLFNTFFHNTTEAFIKLAMSSMNESLAKMNLNESYAILERVLDIKNSPSCKNHHRCELNDKPSIIMPSFERNPRSLPSVNGPLDDAYWIVDEFLTQLYNFGPKYTAWGEIKDSNEWNKLLDVQKCMNNVLFSTTFIARDVGKDLLRYIADSLQNSRKITLLVGHDYNINTILGSLRSMPYNLPEQYENAPMGGKLVFQKWHDSSKKRNLLRTEYVYQSNKQITNSEKLSLDNPPQSYLLKLDGLEVDSEGFSSWDDFMRILRMILS